MQSKEKFLDFDYSENASLIRKLDKVDWRRVNPQLLSILQQQVRQSTLSPDQGLTDANEVIKFIVFITINRKTNRLRFPCKLNWSIQSLKEKIRDYYKLPIDVMTIVGNGEVIKDDTTLAQAHLGEEIIVVLTRKFDRGNRDNFTVEEARKAQEEMVRSGEVVIDNVVHDGPNLLPKRPRMSDDEEYMELE